MITFNSSLLSPDINDQADFGVQGLLEKHTTSSRRIESPLLSPVCVSGKYRPMEKEACHKLGNEKTKVSLFLQPHVRGKQLRTHGYVGSKYLEHMPHEGSGLMGN